jgi:hypothetical protein
MEVLQTRPQKGLWLVSIVTCVGGFRDCFPDSGNQVRLDSLALSLTEVTVTVVLYCDIGQHGVLVRPMVYGIVHLKVGTGSMPD